MAAIIVWVASPSLYIMSTRFTTLSGSSSPAKWFGTYVVDRLHDPHAPCPAADRLGLDKRQQVPGAPDAGHIGHRSVPGNHQVWLELHDAVECGDPIAGGALPHHREDADEQYVAGNDDTRVSRIDDDIAFGVRRTDLHELHGAPGHAQLLEAVERPVGPPQLDIREVEAGERARRHPSASSDARP